MFYRHFVLIAQTCWVSDCEAMPLPFPPGQSFCLLRAEHDVIAPQDASTLVLFRSMFVCNIYIYIYTYILYHIYIFVYVTYICEYLIFVNKRYNYNTGSPEDYTIATKSSAGKHHDCESSGHQDMVSCRVCAQSYMDVPSWWRNRSFGNHASYSSECRQNIVWVDEKT